MDLFAKLLGVIKFGSKLPEPSRAMGIPLKATCMECGGWKLCTRSNDIGWVCLDCQRTE